MVTYDEQAGRQAGQRRGKARTDSCIRRRWSWLFLGVHTVVSWVVEKRNIHREQLKDVILSLIYFD